MTGRLVVMASGAGTNLGAILDAIAEGRLDAEVTAVIVNRRDAGARLRAERAGVPVHYRPLTPYRKESRPGSENGPAAATRCANPPDGVAAGRPPHEKRPVTAIRCADPPDGVAAGRPAPENGPVTATASVACGWDPSVDRRRYDADLADLVAGVEPDLVVLAGWMHLLSSDFLGRFPHRVVNLHPALPGEFPGADAIGDAWKAHQAGRITRTGVMVHFVPDEGVDSGPVIASVEVPIHPGDTFEALSERIHTAEHALIVSAIARTLANQGAADPIR